MSDNMYDIDIDALLGISTHPFTNATQPDTAQVNAPDEPIEVDGSLSAWVFDDPQEFHHDPSPVPDSTHIDWFGWHGTANDAQFGWNTNTGTYGAQSALGQFSASDTQYEGFGFDSTVFGANDMTPFENTNICTTGTDPGMFYEPNLPVSSVGPAFSANNNSHLGTTVGPLIGQGQSFDESASLLPHAGFDATADHVVTRQPVMHNPQQSQYLGAVRGGMQAGHQQKASYQCSTCDYSSAWSRGLEYHAKCEQHAAYRCRIPNCAAHFMVEESLIAHEARGHAPGHSQVEPNGALTCAECGQAFKSRSQQQSHANDSQHSPFQCLCGAKFSRVDVLHRHIDSYAKGVPKFPCGFCKFHSGKLGFRRRDHLVQHLRGYHKFDDEDITKACPSTKILRKRQFATCPHDGCEFFRDDSFHNLPWPEQFAQKPFATQAAFTKHMKEAHGETPFPCDVDGCDKVRSKGYVREKDLMKHRAAKHPEASEYSPKQRPSVYPCRNEGCDKTFSTDTGRFDHERSVHWTWEQRRAYWFNAE